MGVRKTRPPNLRRQQRRKSWKAVRAGRRSACGRECSRSPFQGRRALWGQWTRQRPRWHINDGVLRLALLRRHHFGQLPLLSWPRLSRRAEMCHSKLSLGGMGKGNLPCLCDCPPLLSGGISPMPMYILAWRRRARNRTRYILRQEGQRRTWGRAWNEVAVDAMDSTALCGAPRVYSDAEDSFSSQPFCPVGGEVYAHPDPRGRAAVVARSRSAHSDQRSTPCICCA